MQATSQNKQSDPQQQAGSNSTAQSWWEELGSKLSGLPQEPAQWAKWLSSSLLPVIGLIVLGYALYRTRKELIDTLLLQKNTTEEELLMLRKKVKKLKKKAKQAEVVAKPPQTIID